MAATASSGAREAEPPDERRPPLEGRTRRRAGSRSTTLVTLLPPEACSTRSASVVASGGPGSGRDQATPAAVRGQLGLADDARGQARGAPAVGCVARRRLAQQPDGALARIGIDGSPPRAAATAAAAPSARARRRRREPRPSSARSAVAARRRDAVASAPGRLVGTPERRRRRPSRPRRSTREPTRDLRHAARRRPRRRPRRGRRKGDRRAIGLPATHGSREAGERLGHGDVADAVRDRTASRRGRADPRERRDAGRRSERRREPTRVDRRRDDVGERVAEARARGCDPRLDRRRCGGAPRARATRQSAATRRRARASRAPPPQAPAPVGPPLEALGDRRRLAAAEHDRIEAEPREAGQQAARAAARWPLRARAPRGR